MGTYQVHKQWSQSKVLASSSRVWHPVVEKSCVSFHKCHREALEEVLDGGLLFFAIVESIGSAELGLAWIRLARNMKFRAREI